MTTQLSFSVREDTDDFAHSGCLLSTQHSYLSTDFGTFSRDWAEEDELDELIDSLEAGSISHKQGLLRAQKLLLKFPGQLEIQNFIANRLWSLEMRDESTDVREKAYRQATVLIPPGFKGQISWGEVDTLQRLTGRTKINEHLYWHASTRNGPEWATDYRSGNVLYMHGVIKFIA